MERVAVSVREFCQRLGVGRTTAYKLIADGELEVLKIGRRTLITMRSADDLFERSRVTEFLEG